MTRPRADRLEDFLREAARAVEAGPDFGLLYTDFFELAERHGLAECVPYDPGVHGTEWDAKPGDLIWVLWGPTVG